VIVTTFAKAVQVIEHTLIPLKDGATLAARIWLPEDAEQNPVPAILEYLPYRKRDGTFIAVSLIFAKRAVASCEVATPVSVCGPTTIHG
jgi:predicted acyl esterase